MRTYTYIDLHTLTHALYHTSKVTHFGVTLVSLWDHFDVTLGSLWYHFGITLWSLRGHFGITFFMKLGMYGSIDLTHGRRSIPVNTNLSSWLASSRFPSFNFIISSLDLGGNHEAKLISRALNGPDPHDRVRVGTGHGAGVVGAEGWTAGPGHGTGAASGRLHKSGLRVGALALRARQLGVRLLQLAAQRAVVSQMQQRAQAKNRGILPLPVQRTRT